MSLIMDFIHGVENTAQVPIQFAENYSNTFANLGNKLAGGKDQTIQQNMGGGFLQNEALRLSAATGTNRQLASDTAQIGVAAAGGAVVPGVGEAAAPLSDAAEQVGTNIAGETGGKILGGLAKGSVEGAAIGGAQGVAQGIGQKNSNLALDFIQGAGMGAAVGGALGGGVPAVKGAIDAPAMNQAGAVPIPGAGGNVLDDDTASKAANESDPAKVEKILKPETGPIVAKDVAPAVADSHDPNIVQNAVQNDIQKKLSPGQQITTPDTTGVNQQSPAPTPLPPQTSVSDINTPTQVAEESSAAEANYTPTTNDLLNHFTQLRQQTGDDEKFYNNTILENQEAPGPIGQLSRSIARNVEGRGANISDELDDQLSPINETQQTQDYKDSQLNDLKATSRQLEKDTGQTGLYNNLAKNMVGMNQDEQIAYLSKGLKEARDNGAMAAAHVNKQFGEQTNPTESSEEASLAQSAQQLSPEDINQEPFINAPGEVQKASTMGKAGVMSDMVNMINSGDYTSDEILNHYMQATKSTYGEAQQAFDTVANSEGVNKGLINAKLNPQAGNISFAPVKAAGEDAKSQTLSENAARLNGRQAGEKLQQAGQPAIDAMSQLNDHDLQLTRSLRGRNPEDVLPLAEDKDAFQNYINASKDYNDYAQASGNELGQQIPYKVNYGQRTEWLPKQELDSNGNPIAGSPVNAAYTKQAQYKTFEEGIANGEVPKYESPLDQLKADVNQRAYNQSNLALQKGYEDAFPGQVKLLNQPGDPIPTGYHQLLVPGGENILLPKDIADKVNSQIMTQDAGKFFSKYDTINAIGKETELGGGLFHGFNTIGTFVGQQLTSLKSLTNPGALGKVLTNAFSDTANENYLDDMSKAPSGGVDENHSVLDGARATPLKIKGTSIDLPNPETKGLAGKITSLPGLKQVHEAIFDRQIPTMMLETFRQKTQGLDIFGNADDRENAIKIANQINKEFGVTDHDYDGLTQQQFKVASRFMLAPGYQFGQFGTLLDALTKGGEEGKLARQAVFGKALVMGGLATLGSAAGGDFKGQTPKQVALAIMNKAINPSFDIAGYKVSTPATQISEVAKPIEESIAGAKKGTGISAGPEDFASSHLAFVPSKAEEFGANKNYEGNAVYGKNYFGQPISGGTVAENAISGVLPIPLAQTAQTATGNQSTGAAIANTLGLNAQPQYNLNYAPVAGQTYVEQLEQTPGIPKTKVQSATEFFDLLGQAAKNKTKTVTAMETAAKQGNEGKAQQLANTYNQQLIKTLLPWEQAGGEKYLDSYMVSLLRTAEVTYRKGTENANYIAQTNPTSIGLQIEPLSTLQAQEANTPTTSAMLSALSPS